MKGYTETNFGTGTRPASFDTDKDGIPDEWEKANGLNPNNASDALTCSLDAKGYYTNIEVYANSLVENIMKSENADALSGVAEYYPTSTSTGISQTVVDKGEVASITYYALNGSRLNAPAKGISIRKITYSNGKTVTDKVIK